MNSISKSLALILILIMAFSSLSLLMVKSVFAQGGQTPNYSDYIPTPILPEEFTLNFLQSSYSKTVTDPYTGVNTTQQVNNSTIEIIIRNQPFTPYNYWWQYKDEVVNKSTSLWYNVQAKGHYSEDWTEIYLNNTVTYYPSEINTQSNSSNYTIISLSQSDTNYPAGGQVDFRVRAVAGGFFPPVLYSMINLPLNFISKNSSWSNPQTLTIPASSVSSSPSPIPTFTPTIPEFPMVAVPLILCLISVASILRLKKQNG